MKNLTHEQSQELLGKSLDEIREFIKSHTDAPPKPLWVKEHRTVTETQAMLVEAETKIDQGIIWSQTPQGQEYWSAVTRNLRSLRYSLPNGSLVKKYE